MAASHEKGFEGGGAKVRSNGWWKPPLDCSLQ